MKVNVVLFGKDNVEHARGELTHDLVAERPIVERNGHFYQYEPSSNFVRIAKFKEIEIPYSITEF